MLDRQLRDGPATAALEDLGASQSWAMSGCPVPPSSLYLILCPLPGVGQADLTRTPGADGTEPIPVFLGKFTSREGSLP